MKKWVIVIAVLLIIGLIIISAMVFGMLAIRKANVPVSNPVVDIRSPSASDEILTGQPIMLQAVARDPDGVTRIEFWLDQKLLHYEDSPWKEGITPLPFAYSFRLMESGSHAIIVRAFDTTGNQGQSSFSMTISQGDDPAAPKAYEIKEEDTLASIADAHGLSEEEVSLALPEGSSDLPAAGEEITLPPPPDTEGEADLPDDAAAPPADYIPNFIPRPLTVMPAWYNLLGNLFEPALGPVGLMDLTILEVNRPYDGVYCYVSAGDSPVIRTPSTGSYTHLDGNFWDIAEWFSGDRALSFVSTSGDLRLRMNCMGYTIGTAGGMAYNLGTLDITRPPADYAAGWMDERAEGPDGWFRVRFRAGSSSDDGHGGGGIGDSYLSLTWGRYGLNENPITPTPHVTLEFNFYEFSSCGPGCESPLVPPPVVDGFFLFRNGELWRTIPDSRASRYTLWDSLWEAGGCFEETDFYIKGYIGNPESPSRTVDSNIVTIPGYCPVLYRNVTVRFLSIYYECIDVDKRTRGGLVVSGACGGPPEDWGEGVLGGVDVNGSRTFNIWYPLYTGMYVTFPIWGSTIIPTRVLVLSPEESLTISSRMWDYDVWSTNDPFCHDEVIYSPSDLAGMISGTTYFEETFSDINWFNDDEPLDTSGGSCIISYDITVDEVAGPPPPVIVTIP